jgi:hypothetical protein
MRAVNVSVVNVLEYHVITMLVEPEFGCASNDRDSVTADALADAPDVPETTPPVLVDPSAATNFPPVMVAVAVSPLAGVNEVINVPVARSTAVCVVASPSCARSPTEPIADVAAVDGVEALPRPAVPPVVLAVTFVASPAAALADDIGATESSPAPSADTATSAMRLRSVFVDMYFLSLVRFRNFLDLARRSFDLLIPLLL